MFTLDAEEDTPENRKALLREYFSDKYPDRLKKEADLSKPADIISSQPQSSTASEYERLANDDSELKDAIAAQDRDKNAGLWGDALSSLVTARGSASGYKRDGSFYDKLGTRSDSKVQNAKASKQSKIDNFLRKDQLNYQDSERARQGVMRGREDSDYARTQEIMAQESDASSDVSKSYQTLAYKMVGGKRDFSGMSAAQLKQQLPSLEKLYAIDENNKTRKETAQQRAFENSVKRDEKAAVQKVANDEKEQAFKTPYGKANTKEDAKALKEAHESKMSFDSKIKEMIALREEYGVEYMDRDAVERGKQLSKDLLLEYKNMAKLGVLSQADEDIINAIIPADPLGQDFAPGQDPILYRLKKFQEDKDKDFQTRVKTRTRSGMDSYGTPEVKPDGSKPGWAK